MKSHLWWQLSHYDADRIDKGKARQLFLGFTSLLLYVTLSEIEATSFRAVELGIFKFEIAG